MNIRSTSLYALNSFFLLIIPNTDFSLALISLLRMILIFLVIRSPSRLKMPPCREKRSVFNELFSKKEELSEELEKVMEEWIELNS